MFSTTCSLTVDSLTATHSGSSGVCPTSQPRQGPCNGGRSSCVDGLCSGSVCLNNNLQDCQCTGSQAQLCHVCCMVDGVCQSTFNLGDRVKLYFYLSLSSSPLLLFTVLSSSHVSQGKIWFFLLSSLLSFHSPVCI